MGSIPGSGRSPGEGNSPVFLPGEFHGQRSLAGLQSMVSQRVRHDWMSNTPTHSAVNLFSCLFGGVIIYWVKYT